MLSLASTRLQTIFSKFEVILTACTVSTTLPTDPGTDSLPFSATPANRSSAESIKIELEEYYVTQIR